MKNKVSVSMDLTLSNKSNVRVERAGTNKIAFWLRGYHTELTNDDIDSLIEVLSIYRRGGEYPLAQATQSDAHVAFPEE